MVPNLNDARELLKNIIREISIYCMGKLYPVLWGILQANPAAMVLCTAVIIIISFGICSIGLSEWIFAAMGQAFFPLSIGIGTLSVFGSRIDKSHSLTSNALYMGALDTVVALLAGLIIFISGYLSFFK